MQGVLSGTHYSALNKALAKINETRLLLESMEKSGMDVTGLADLLDEQENRVKSIKAEFFPDRK